MPLAHTFSAYLDCVVIDYPVDWTVDHTGALGEQYPSICPGWPRSGTTDVVTDCENDIFIEVQSGLITLKGPGEQIVGGPGTAPYVSLDRYQERCPTLERDLARWLLYNGSKPTDDPTITGQQGLCMESRRRWMDESAIHAATCFFVFVDVLYTIDAHTLESDWSQVEPLFLAMRDSLRLTTFPACGGSDFPPQHAHFCP